MTERQDNRIIIHNGLHATEALNTMKKDIPAESLRSIAEKATKIIEYSVDPVVGPPEQPSDGLLYGMIQSGKTSIIIISAAMAVDNGFKCIIILTSDINPLYAQTLERVSNALRGLDVLGKKDWEDPARFERRIRTSPFVVVCSKNAKTLTGLLEAFKSAGGKGARGLPVMIIDDEADQASLNTFTSKGAQEISRINNLITKFRDFFPTNTYLQVTATPQALFLQKPNHRYRPSFTVLSEPGLDYVGGEVFFESDSNEAESKLLRIVDLEEVEQLRAMHQPNPADVIPPGLKRALHTFFVAATAKMMQGHGENYAFLCHVSYARMDHRHIVELIDRFKEETINKLSDSSSGQHYRLIKDLREAYGDLSKTHSSKIGLPEFDSIVEKIKFYLPGTKIKLIDSSSPETITLNHVYSIFVGGNKLGRGVTIKNLLVSYYGRNPKRPNSDTVLQHARMYGYRKNEIGVTRLFLPEKLAEHFRIIHQMENALRELVENRPKGEFEGIYIESPVRPTRSNVLDPNSIGMYIAGRNYNPTYPLRTEEIQEKTNWLDSKLANFRDKTNGKEVTVDLLIELVEKCIPDPQHGIELWDLKTIGSALEELKSIRGNKAYLVVRRGRNLMAVRRETQGILDSGEDKLAPKDAPTLFMYRQNEIPAKREIAVWWPQLRFPEGNYAMAFSFNR